MNDDKPTFATGGPVTPGRIVAPGEDRICNPLGLLGDQSKLRELITATDPATFWPEPPPDGYLGIHAAATTPAPPLTMDTLTAILEKYAPAEPQPRAYRMNPDTIAELPHAEPNPLAGLNPLLGTPVIPDTRIPRGWITADFAEALQQAMEPVRREFVRLSERYPKPLDQCGICGEWTKTLAAHWQTHAWIRRAWHWWVTAWRGHWRYFR